MEKQSLFIFQGNVNRSKQCLLITQPFWVIVKRTIDVLITILVLVVLAPFIIVLMLLIKIDSAGPVFYWQERVGKGGKIFRMVKFRTMVIDADTRLVEYLSKNQELKREWDCYQKLKNDPRVTRVGRLLRRCSADEIPQFWNVLIGDMSIVGPRPYMKCQEDIYSKEGKQYYKLVKPGITGLWQVSTRNDSSFIKRGEYSRTYMENWSLFLDFRIMVQTVLVVLGFLGW